MTPELQEKIAGLPTQPGVYLMKDRQGEVIYVGKAVNLRNRVRSYFDALGERRPRASSRSSTRSSATSRRSSSAPRRRRCSSRTS